MAITARMGSAGPLVLLGALLLGAGCGKGDGSDPGKGPLPGDGKDSGGEHPPVTFDRFAKPGGACPGLIPTDVMESKLRWRDLEQLRARDELVSRRKAAAPGGNVRLQYDSGGRLVRWTFDPDGYKDDVQEDFSYDSGGRLVRWKHDADGYMNDVEETFSYDAGHRLTRWKHDADGYKADLEETFSYDSDGRLTRFQQRGEGVDVSRSFTYNCR